MATLTVWLFDFLTVFLFDQGKKYTKGNNKWLKRIFIELCKLFPSNKCFLFRAQKPVNDRSYIKDVIIIMQIETLPKIFPRKGINYKTKAYSCRKSFQLKNCIKFLYIKPKSVPRLPKLFPQTLPQILRFCTFFCMDQPLQVQEIGSPNFDFFEM